ncbi:MAG: putative metal-dependent hydrolase [Sphingobacteriales bacterium]|jgi:hypothetical protein|nr:putative metal-dependent hydrolase [Sphingobacteriales bacterium]
MEELKYPVGKFKMPSSYDEAFRIEAIQILSELPVQLQEVLNGIQTSQLAGCYRPDGWNIKQVVHHLADSHLNCLVRVKLALTEDHPTIKPYDENSWANLADATSDDIQPSLLIITGVHARLVTMLNSLSTQQWERTVHHPESKRDMSINFLLGLYSWHSRHHLAHIKNAIANPY